MLVDHERGFAFLHIPKTAGVAITKALGERHRPGHHDLKGLAGVEGLFRFCFVRDPVSRFVSAYKYSVMMAGRGKLNGHPVRTEIIEQGLDSNLEAFIGATLAKRPERLLKNLHFRPQIRWVSAGRPAFIGRYETLERDLEWVTRFLGLPAPRLEPANESTDDLDTRLTSRSRRLIGEVYRDDVELLGYSG